MKIVARRFAKSLVVISLALAGACSSSSDGNNGSGGNGGEGGNGGGGGGTGGGGGGQMSEGGKGSGGTAGNSNGGGGGMASGGSAASGGAGGVVSGGAGGSAGGAGGMQMGGAGGLQAGGAGGMQTAGASGNPNFGGALFLAVGQGKTALSTDGKVWTSYADGMTPNQLEILGACILDSVVVAVNHGGAAGAKQGVWTSTNGHNFVRTFPADANVDGLPGEDCAAGKGVISAGARYTLDQGKTWQNSTSNGGVGNRGVAFGNNVFVGAGDNNIDWSADGKAWSKGTVVGGGGVTGLSHVYFGGNKFVALPYNNANPAYESTDGKSWTKTKTALPAGSNSNNGGAAAKKIFVVTSAGIYWLSDSSAPGTEAWTKSLSSFDDGAIGGNDTIAVSAKHWSTDGMTWSLSATPVLKDFGIARILKLTP